MIEFTFHDRMNKIPIKCVLHVMIKLCKNIKIFKSIPSVIPSAGLQEPVIILIAVFCKISKEPILVLDAELTASIQQILI